MSGTGSGRGGYTLVEATTALALAGLLTAILAGILFVVGRLASAHARVSAQADTERAVGTILGAELRALTASDASFGRDSVRLRAFRGGGAICSASGSMLTVLYHGARTPEPDKDSVLLVWPDAERAFPIGAAVRADGGCAAEGNATVFRIDAPWLAARADEPPALALVFETGAYSLANGAFRYRLGAAGRQPLSEENLSDAGSALVRVEPGGGAAVAAITLRPSGSPRSATTAWSLHMPQGALRAAELP